MAIGFIYLGIIYAPYYMPIPKKSENTFRLISSNVRIHKTDVSRQAAYLKTLDADIVGLVEVSDAWQQELPALKSNFPHIIITEQGQRVGRITYGDRFMVLSKWPVTHVKNIQNAAGLYHIEAPQPFYFLLVHPMGPLTKRMDNERIAWYENIVKEDLPTPLVVAGDFNAVPWDTSLINMVKRHSLTYASHWLPTYRTDVPAVPIDHVFYTDGLSPTRTQRINLPTTDHFSMLADFEMRSQ